MPALRASTLKQRAKCGAQNASIRKRDIRRTIAKMRASSPYTHHSFGTISRFPYELRQAIFEQLIPPETPPAANKEDFQMDEKTSKGTNSRRAPDSPKGLLALLCTSRAFSTEIRHSYQNREYQLTLSTYGIAFEGVRSSIELKCYCSGCWYPGARCNHCVKGLIWKAAGSHFNRPLRLCNALRGLRKTVPTMRRLHVTFVIEPFALREREFRRICSASGIWGILQRADSAGVKLRFTLEIKDQVVPRVHSFNNPLPQRIIPPEYESRTTIKRVDAPL
jgi:hypothetical protein